jgi:hypothetical protein
MEMALEAGPPESAEIVAAECVVEAETKDPLNCELLGEVATVVKSPAREALKQALVQLVKWPAAHADDRVQNKMKSWPLCGERASMGVRVKGSSSRAGVWRNAYRACPRKALPRLPGRKRTPSAPKRGVPTTDGTVAGP